MLSVIASFVESECVHVNFIFANVDLTFYHCIDKRCYKIVYNVTFTEYVLSNIKVVLLYSFDSVVVCFDIVIRFALNNMENKLKFRECFVKYQPYA